MQIGPNKDISTRTHIEIHVWPNNKKELTINFFVKHKKQILHSTNGLLV